MGKCLVGFAGFGLKLYFDVPMITVWMEMQADSGAHPLELTGVKTLTPWR
jgi:hypothetical protein